MQGRKGGSVAKEEVRRGAENGSGERGGEWEWGEGRRMGVGRGAEECERGEGQRKSASESLTCIPPLPL
jgi:hypothetical protein